MLTGSARAWPNRRPFIAVRRHDAHATWTWIALGGFALAVVLAVVGVPSVDLHGPLHYLGIMDPLCGGTRSVYLTLHGQLREAVRYNPAGPLLVAAAAVILIRAAVGRSTRYWVHVRMPRCVVIPVAVVAIAALEVNQQLNAALLSAPWLGA